MTTDPLSGDTATTYPEITPHFTLDGTIVTGTGTTTARGNDQFWGLAGQSYSITIDHGADLFITYGNSINTEVNGFVGVAETTTLNTPNGELIAIDNGLVMNNGTLNVFPTPPPNGTNYDYYKTATVLYLADGGTLLNTGTIGDEAYISKTNYAQEDFCAVYEDANTYGYIENEAGAVLEGYNAIFTAGTGSIDNYGTIYASNDCILSGFIVDNHLNAGLNSGVAGFAGDHVYNTMFNYGYVLGNDYGLLVTGNHVVVDDYAGTAVSGVRNFNGSQLYNGEISALVRGPETVQSTGNFSGSDAIDLQSSGETINLYAEDIGGTLYIPVILGPMEGGFDASGTSHSFTTLNLNLAGLSGTDISEIETAIENSRTIAQIETIISGVTKTVTGTYYSGSVTLTNLSDTAGGESFQWEDFAQVNVMCFCAGTRIATDQGNIAVEDLKIGDVVKTLHAGHQKIKFIGRRSYAGRFASHKNIRPVRIARNAIADNVPSRELLVSPSHALFIAGALIYAERLINGVTITRAAQLDQISYYHIELETHEILLAENCPAESFYDYDFRDRFDNASEYRVLYPNPAARTEPRPILWEGFELENILRRLRALAGIAQAPVVHGPLRGFIDQIGPLEVTGWAQCAAQPDEPVALDILVGGRIVARTLANRYREDLEQAGLGSGNHAFRIALPFSARGPVTVRRSFDHTVLPRAGRKAA